MTRTSKLSVVFLAATLFACLPVSAKAQSAVGPNSANDSGPHLDLWVGLDGAKQPVDLGINANMGFRTSANLGMPLSRRAGLGAQFGVGFNASDSAVHVLDQIEGTSRRTQTYITVGLFQRADRAIRWGLAYDWLNMHYYDNVTLGQWRGEVDYAVSRADRLGVWFTAGARGADAQVTDTGVRLDPISQANVYAEHRWKTGAITRLWVGVAAAHHNFILVLPDATSDKRVPVYGAELRMPLNDRFAVSGSTNLITPTSTGTVDAYLGVVVGIGGRHEEERGFAPLSPVANNPMFAVDLRPR